MDISKTGMRLFASDVGNKVIRGELYSNSGPVEQERIAQEDQGKQLELFYSP